MDEITLINLLNEISKQDPKLNWSINCHYENDESETKLEITVLQKYPLKQKGIISFNMENGSIINFSYEGFHPTVSPTHITDLLLDIINFEHTRSYAMSN